MSASRRRFVLPLLVAEAVVLLAVAEGALRLVGLGPLAPPAHRAESILEPDPVLGYRLTPGVSNFTVEEKAWTRSFRVSRDAHGHRITSAEPRPGRPVIWILGCSFTFGSLLSDEQTFPWIVQERLPEYRVVNRGVVAYSTLHSLLQVENELEGEDAPAAVVIAHAAFHDQRNVCSRGWERVLLTRYPYPCARLSGDSLTRFLRAPTGKALPFAEDSALVGQAERVIDRIDYWRLSAPAVTERLLFAAAERCRARGVRFAVADIWGDPQTEPLLGRLEAASIPVLRVAPDYRARGMAFPYDGHPMPAAARLLGERLAAGLRERVLR